ncbi:MAG: S26 family signal peptidase, partial [Synechococcales cyanobacterium RM1_1_8]|nr:S26 family signal peptidase [Synechococcales cyanobacterium RM1_1_8]
MTPFAWLAWLLLPVAAIHAYGATPDVDEHRQTNRQTVEIVLVAWLLPILLGAITAFGLRTFVLEARFIPSGSMEPTLQLEDRLIVDKLRYRFQ